MSSNDHGWTVVGVLDGQPGSRVSIGAFVEERKRCACSRSHCRREATQEDLRCDECRETCR